MQHRKPENWWVTGLRGLVAVLFGVATLVWPDVTVGILVLLFGIYALMDGAFALLEYAFGTIRTPRWTHLGGGLLSVAAGLVVLLWSGLTPLPLLWIIASWAVLRSGIEIIVSVAGGRRLENAWLLGLAGVLAVLLALFYLVFEDVEILLLVRLLGLYVLAYGAILLLRAFRVRADADGSLRRQ